MWYAHLHQKETVPSFVIQWEFKLDFLECKQIKIFLILPAMEKV